MNVSPRSVLNVLVKNQVITQNEANQLEVEAFKKNLSISDYLFRNTSIAKEDVLSAIAEVLHVPFVDVSTLALDPQAIGLVPEAIATSNVLLPVKYNPKDETLVLATTDPFNITIADFLERKTGKKVVMALGFEDDIKKAIQLAYSQNLSPEVKEALKEVKKGESSRFTAQINPVIKEAPIAKIVNTILEFAVKSRASDIHIEPEETRTKVRYRIDGVLQEKLSLPRDIHDALISRIKILSEMKIDEKRIPQDGRFYFKLGDDEVDLRVSTLPTVHGEKIVLRLLKKTGGLPNLNQLGLRGFPLKDLQEAITKPYGIILVTGPTGSGKTTTLYSILSILNKPSVNIVTIEDPVEYQIPGINQVQINPQAGLTFASGLRSFLRQDPNVILVGEIRDKETTQLAIQAALTGHLVFSTLHTNNSATAIPRLIDLGGEPFLIASVLNACLAQRIVRRICSSCKESYIPPVEVQKTVRDTLGDYLPKIYSDGKQITLYKGRGCSECDNSGYYGRIAIFEVLKVSSTINTMILKQATANELEEVAKKEGLITMKQDGFLKALEGITTIEEVLRVAEF